MVKTTGTESEDSGCGYLVSFFRRLNDVMGDLNKEIYLTGFESSFNKPWYASFDSGTLLHSISCLESILLPFFCHCRHDTMLRIFTD